jgi:hypothetical protein
MSALPLRAEMCSAARDVCFGPKADIVNSFRRADTYGYFSPALRMPSRNLAIGPGV